MLLYSLLHLTSCDPTGRTIVDCYTYRIGVNGALMESDTSVAPTAPSEGHFWRKRIST